MSGKEEIVKQERPTRRKRPLTIWEKIAKIFKEATEGGTPVPNRNKVYSQFGVSTGSPIYSPKRTKLKGYQKDHKGRKIRK